MRSRRFNASFAREVEQVMSWCGSQLNFPQCGHRGSTVWTSVEAGQAGSASQAEVQEHPLTSAVRGSVPRAEEGEGRVRYARSACPSMNSSFLSLDLAEVPWWVRRDKINLLGFFWRPDGLFSSGQELIVPAAHPKFISACRSFAEQGSKIHRWIDEGNVEAISNVGGHVKVPWKLFKGYQPMVQSSFCG